MLTSAVQAPPAARMATALTPKAPSTAAARLATGRRPAVPGPVQVGRMRQGRESLCDGPVFLGDPVREMETGLRSCGWSLETHRLV